MSGELDLLPPHVRVRFYRTWDNVKRDHQQRPASLEGTCGLWIHGPPGSGKSHFVNDKFPGCYIKDASKWWCGYQGEAVVWLDDVDPDQSAWIARFLKIWADKYPFQAQNKGSSLTIRPERFLVTSNYSIAEMGFRPVDLAAITRRFKEVYKADINSEIII